MNPEPRTLLRGARVWLTGASSGIGAALVTRLVDRGARVAITARRADLLEAIARANSAGGSSPLVVPADVTDPAAVAAAARRIESEWGGIDLAIFNAGGAVAKPSAIADRNPQFAAPDYSATMALNYFSVVYGIDAVLPGMLARGSGHIAAVASLAGYRRPRWRCRTARSKAAVIHLIEGLRLSTVRAASPSRSSTPASSGRR